MRKERIKTRVEVLSLDGEGFLRSVIADRGEIELEDAINAITACAQLSGRKRLPILVDLRKVKSISRDARLYYGSSDEAQKVLIAVAFLVTSPLSRVIASFFIGLNKMKVDAKVFSSEEKAQQWLKGYLK